jgi:hypothetical protein
MIKVTVTAAYMSDKTGRMEHMRSEHYALRDLSDLLDERVKTNLPVNHDVILGLKEKGKFRQEISPKFYMMYKLEKLDPKVVHHYSHLKQRRH